MALEESINGPKPEKYQGSEIEEIIIEGETMIFREVRVLLKNGSHITLNPGLNLSQFAIKPQIIASRGKWAKIPSG